MPDKFIDFANALKRNKEHESSKNAGIEIDSPDSHKDALAERKAKIEDGAANFISLNCKAKVVCRTGAFRE